MPLPIAALFGAMGSAAGAGASIIGGQQAAEAQEQATLYNWMLNMYRMRKEDKWRQQAIDYARDRREEDQLGTTDPSGTTRFIKGKGWVTEESPEAQSRRKRGLVEEQDRQRMMRKQSSGQTDDRLMADMFREQLMRVRRGSKMGESARRHTVQTRGANEALNEALNNLGRSSLRTGSNYDEAAAEIGKASAEQRGQSKLQADLTAGDAVDSKYFNELEQLSNLYNLFAERASKPLGQSASPQQLQSSDGRLAIGNAQTSNQGGFAASRMRGGLPDYIQANDAHGKALIASGGVIAGAGREIGSSFNKGSANNELNEYFKERARKDTGVF